jgi:hypothetical protein
MGKHDYYDGDIQSGRKESPGIEHAVQREVVRVLTELLETKGLYQNLWMSEAIFAKLPPAFVREFRKRPLVPHSRGDGDDDRSIRRSGVQPLGTPQEEMDVGLYLPNLTLDCAKCKCSRTFLSMSCSNHAPYGEPYPILGADTEQVFSLYYRCAVCRHAYVVFQILRVGMKMQLTGRSVPFRPKLERGWPKEIRNVVQDAHVAAAEADVPAAYYHLRTALEFYMKQELGIPVTTKADGSDLCEKYNVQADKRLKAGFPSLTSLYSELSAGLHSRDAVVERFAKLSEDFLGHLKAKELFAEYAA